MRLRATRPGGDDPFEGDRILLLQAVPEGALVSAAQVFLEPVSASGPGRFEETIRFQGQEGELGATKVGGTGFVEVDFHARRTLASVVFTGPAAPRLLVDMGGAWIGVDKA